MGDMYIVEDGLLKLPSLLSWGQYISLPPLMLFYEVLCIDIWGVCVCVC